MICDNTDLSPNVKKMMSENKCDISMTVSEKGLCIDKYFTFLSKTVIINNYDREKDVYSTFVLDLFKYHPTPLVKVKQSSKPVVNTMPKNGKVTVVLKGITLPTYKSSAQTVQDFVRQTVRTLLNNNLLSDGEIHRLQDKSYCRKTCYLEFPLLAKEWKNCTDPTGHVRYWVDKIGGFYVCSQWWKQRFPIYEQRIADWLKELEIN